MGLAAVAVTSVPIVFCEGENKKPVSYGDVVWLSVFVDRDFYLIVEVAASAICLQRSGTPHFRRDSQVSS
jgi:hypothetical protein